MNSFWLRPKIDKCSSAQRFPCVVTHSTVLSTSDLKHEGFERKERPSERWNDHLKRSYPTGKVPRLPHCPCCGPTYAPGPGMACHVLPEASLAALWLTADMRQYLTHTSQASIVCGHHLIWQCIGGHKHIKHMCVINADFNSSFNLNWILTPRENPCHKGNLWRNHTGECLTPSGAMAGSDEPPT